MNPAVRRALRKVSHYDAVDQGLAALSGSQLRTLLLHVFRLRAERPLRAMLTQQQEAAAVHPGPRRLHDHLVPALKRTLPSVEVGFDLGRARQATYFTGFGFHVHVELPGGGFAILVDGGFVDWVARLRSDRREQTLTSGAGIELLPRLFPAI